MYDNGSDIWCGGIEYHGVIALSDGWWLAFVKHDPGMALRLVREDQV